HKKEILITDSLQRHLGLDSLGRAELIRRIEKKYDVIVPDALLAKVDSLQDIAMYLTQANPIKAAQAAPKTMIHHHERSSVNPQKVATLVELLLLYAEQSPEKNHIYFYNENGQEELISYGKLLNEALKAAAGLKALGLKEGETVAIMQPTQPGF